MSYSVGSHYVPQTSTGDPSTHEEYADNFIYRARHSHPGNVFMGAVWLAKQSKFCSLFEYKVISTIKRKLRIR